jgi:hypothetical protein
LPELAGQFRIRAAGAREKCDRTGTNLGLRERSRLINNS